MSYLKEFQSRIAHHDYAAILRLWEEYCSSDELDVRECAEILRALKKSDMADSFGKYVDKILPLWKTCSPSPETDAVFKFVIDLQTSNSDALRLETLEFLKTRYENTPHFTEKLRLTGLRNRDNFQCAVSNFELLTHMVKGNYVFHSGGWGVGEILDVSLLREQLSVEFDYVPGKRDLSFAMAFKTLTCIPKDHFLALRFGSPEVLEDLARENPTEVIRMLLRDLGPKTAADIKEELCDLVIPGKEWSKWWQQVRAKIKKDTMIETPEDLKEPFILRSSGIAHEERVLKVLEKKLDAAELIHVLYSFIKDFPETLKNTEFRHILQTKLKELFSLQEVTNAQELQLHFFLQDLSTEKAYPAISELIKRISPPFEDFIQSIDILAFKKRTLVEMRKTRPEWKEIFLNLFFIVDENSLRDYLFSELSNVAAKELKQKLQELLEHPAKHPETFLWYFQKAISSTSLPFTDKEGKILLFEAFLVLLSSIENNNTYRDLVKKMHGLLTGGRFAIVRQIMQNAPLEACKEFLLLATKCHSLEDHDIKILHSLAEVVHPSLGKMKKGQETGGGDKDILWSSQAGYQKLQQRIQHIATVETVENAKEIEVARAHGDLRENAEFKAALERRDRLQSELKTLSDQLNRARVLTKEDISTEEVGPGSIVECTKKGGKQVTYTLLGPWDADPDKNILAFQSKLAQAMKGLTVGDTFQFQGEEYTIAAIRSYL